jgi:AcrR family transcriptional regulator
MEKIKAAGLKELRRTGAAGLSLREVAKTAGISPAGMYRYVDGRDGLLELLISDGFEAFGSAIDKAIKKADDDLLSRLEAIAFTYRRWALANPERFGLILGTPVPGFHARSDGPTTASVYRFGEPMVRVVAAAYGVGDLVGLGTDVAAEADVALAPTTFLPESLTEMLARGWSRIHGLVSLELYGHLAWGEFNVEKLLQAEMRLIMDELSDASLGKVNRK